MAYYCVFQDGATIFGIGKTKVGALRDANKWLARKVTLKEIDHRPRHVGDVALAPCTKGVYDYIQAGGEPSAGWIYYNGTVRKN
jgi:hypothetical protein